MSSSAGYPGSGGSTADRGGSRASRGGLDAVLDRCRDTGVARRTQDRWVAGVCTGLGVRWGVDPVIARVGFILLTVFGGVGVALYLLCWLLLPADDGTVALERALRHGDGSAITLLVVTAVVVLNGPLTWMSDSNGFWGFVGLVVAAAAVWTFFRLGRGTRQGGATGQAGAQPPAPVEQSAGMPAGAQNAWQQGWQAGSSAGGAHAESSAGTQAGAPVSPIPPVQDTLRPITTPSGSTDPDSVYAPAGEVGASMSTALATDPRTATPPARRASSGDLLISLIVAGAAILAYLGGNAAARAWEMTGRAVSPTTTGLAAGLFVLGVALVVTALARRRPPLLRVATWIVGLSLLTTFSHAPAAGDTVWRPTSAAELTSYEHGVGTATLDLTGLPVDGTRSVDIDQGIGELTIVLPSGVSAQLAFDNTLGTVDVVGSSGSRELAAGTVSGTYIVGSGPRAYEIAIKGGIGSVIAEIGPAPVPAPSLTTAPAQSSSPRSPATTSEATR